MKKTNALAFRLPLILGLALTLGGCYTMLKHPSAGDLTAGHETDYRYSDCASCHYEGFSQPLFPDPYGYMAPWMVGYYGCPWWLPDCGYGYGGSSGGGWGGYAGGDNEVGPDDQRNIGGRGAVRGGTGVPSALPSVAPPNSGGRQAAPSVRPNDSNPGSSSPPAAQPAPGQSRTNKRSNSSPPSTSPSKDTGKKDSRTKDKPKH